MSRFITCSEFLTFVKGAKNRLSEELWNRGRSPLHSGAFKKLPRIAAEAYFFWQVEQIESHFTVAFVQCGGPNE